MHDAQATTEPAGSIGDLLGGSMTVGKPDVAGPLAVFPVFGPEPRLEYVAFAEAVERGLRVAECDGGASVNQLVIENPTDLLALVYEGEEVLGAQQNRIFDISLLVPPGATYKVPVSCVEAGRWDAARGAEGLGPAQSCAYPELRRMKAARKAARAGRPMRRASEAVADQGEVWSLVDSKSIRHRTPSPTRAMHDIYEGRRSALDAIRRVIHPHPGQIGTIAAIGGEIRVLDCVSRPDCFAHLHGPLVRGYALDALEARETEPPAIETARGFLLLVADSAVAEPQPRIGLGDELRLASSAVAGSALYAEGELVQLTAFPG